MPNRKISRNILKSILFITIMNMMTIVLWLSFKVEPVIKESKQIKEEIVTKELKSNYTSYEALLTKVEELSNEYPITISITDVKEDKKVKEVNLEKNNLFLFSKVIIIENQVYLLNGYINQKFNLYPLLLQSIFFQIIVMFIVFVLIFTFAKFKIIRPVDKIVQDIRNYKLGKKPTRVQLNNEFDMIQNEFVDLVDNLEEERCEKNRIIASISHDIKTPLTAIIGYSNLINDDDIEIEDMKTYNKVIYDKSIHIKNLLNSFDDYLVNDRNQKLELKTMTIKGLRKQLLEDYQLELASQQIEFQVISKLSEEEISIDILKIKRIFSNIIQNSISYLKEDGKITIYITKEKNDYKFMVADNGPGVDEKIIKKIFNPFFTTDSSRKISGLGLSICKEFVEMHGGEIEAKNKSGLCVIFTIPIRIAKEKE